MLGYSVLEGMWALTATDIVQFVIKTVGILFVLLPIALRAKTGHTNLRSLLCSMLTRLRSPVILPRSSRRQLLLR